MSDFNRRQFTPDELRAIRRQKTSWLKGHPMLGPHLNHPGSQLFTIEQLLIILQLALGNTFLKVLLDTNAAVALQVARVILDDHLHEGDVSQKDLQVNLVVNCVVRLTRAQNLLLSRRFGYGEDLIRKGQFPAEFKLRIKEALFDQGALQSSSYMIVRVSETPNDPGIWMRD